MPEVDLYDGYYDQFSTDVLGAIRRETYGEDLGQSSWMTADELRHFISLLELKKSDSFLEVASGSGGCSLFIAEQVGCKVIGIDINEFGIRNSNELARKRKLDSTARFQLTDAGHPLPFEENRFDAVFSNDAICHIPGRLQILKEWHRVLKPGGRMLFTDALVVTGLVSHEEIAQRSSIGYYDYSPPGVNERLIQDCNFELIQTEDLTAQAALISQRWHNARERHRDALLKLEGETKFKGLQDFLKCVHKRSGEKRLSRFMYLAKKGL
jgi:ubiquinone/menaquinone biosynthesis C-methylase UbiE